MADVSCLAVTQPSPATTEIPAAPQVATLAPRPAEPTQRLTARPLGHDLDPYKVPETVKAAPAVLLHAPTRRPGALIGREFTFDRGAYDASYDRFQHAADRAFGEDLPRGAA